jgi:hypothetical protein
VTSAWESLRVVTDVLQPHGGGLKGAQRRRELDDWSAPIEFANAHLLTPAMFAALKASHRLAAVPEDVRDYLKLLHGHNLERNAALRVQALEVFAAMAAADVPAMPLKGGLSQFVGHFPDSGARLFRDTDLLVPRPSLMTAVQALERLGYVATTRYEPVVHAYAEFMRKGDPGAVDLHVEIIDANYILPARELWERASPTACNGVPLHLPSPTDQILHNVLHAQIHYTGNFYRAVLQLQQIYEFALLARHHGNIKEGGAIDWPAIEARFARHGLTTALQSYALAATEWFALPWPLAARPTPAARAHHLRCLAQLRAPMLKRALLPWGNLRAAFASHRMHALYGDSHPLVPRPVLHAWKYARKTDPRGMVDRLFKLS